MTSGRFTGLIAAVTGGAAGIGAEIVRQLLVEGADVVSLDLVGSRDVHPRLWDLRADISDDSSVRAAVAAIDERHGRLDVLVNNAGVGAQGDVERASDEDWSRVLDINVVGTARMTRAALPLLRSSSSAAVVNVGSIAATAGLPERVVYSASKGAVLAMTRAMAADHLADGIRVNCVNPGTADTPWVGRLLADAADPDAERRALEARQPHGRLVRPSEVAAAVLFLASPASGSVTGTDLAVDGGMQGLRLRPR